MGQYQLTPEEREFCSLVTQTSTVNQFSEERFILDRKIAQVPDSYSKSETFAKLLERLTHFIAQMEKEGRADIRKFSGKDREILQVTFLFEIFHQFMDDFDRHILEQVDAGAKLVSVKFADKALAYFQKRGFSIDERLEWFSILYQLRRAYFFIQTKLVGSSPCMYRLRESLWNNVFTSNQVFYKHNLLTRMEDFSTLLLGDTGTGKGTAAAAIGRSGYIPFNMNTKTFRDSFTGAFVSLNLSQYPEALIESELFGHRKGAFTGAIEAHDGIFATCSPYGAIFLDEIGDASIPIQIKLLHVLQDRTFSPVGSHKKLRFSGRVIAATNKDINALRRQKLFRDDFFYRLCSDIITVPSLYERIRENEQELSDLVDYAVVSIVGRENPELTDQVITIINNKLGRDYSWPGNVRELEQCVRRIILKQDYEGDRMPKDKDPISQLVNDIRSESIDASSLLSQYCKMLYQKHGTYEAVGKIAGLDRRTVKKYIEIA